MQISGSTTLLALIGHPIAHTLSPAMHNAAAAALGIDMVYLPFDVPPHHLASAVRGLAALGVRGANVTVPHKEAIVPHLGALDPASQACGSVRCWEKNCSMPSSNARQWFWCGPSPLQNLAGLQPRSCLHST
jgi:shikimate dehydrogenase